jgi:hypothetical protein
LFFVKAIGFSLSALSANLLHSFKKIVTVLYDVNNAGAEQSPSPPLSLVLSISELFKT